MKFKIEKNDLAPLVANVAKCSKGTLEVTSGVKISAETDKILLTGNCFEIAGQFTTSTATIDKVGECLVDGKLFSDFMKSLPSGEVVLELKKNVLHVKYGNNEMKFNTIDESSFSEPDFSGNKVFSGKAREIHKALKEIAFATASGPVTNESFKGILIEPSEKSVFFVATDAIRMAWAELSLECEADTKMIVPPTLVGLIGSVFADEEITVLSGGNKVIIQGDNAVISGSLFNGAFPNWKAVVASLNSPAIIHEAGAAIKDSLSRMKIFADKKAPSVSLTVGDGKLLLHSSSSIGEISEELVVKTSGTIEGPVRFNSLFLFEALTALEDNEFDLQITGGIRPLCMAVGSRSASVLVGQTREIKAEVKQAS